MSSRFDVLECLEHNVCDPRLQEAVRAAILNLERSTERYETKAGLPVEPHRLADFYRRRLELQRGRGRVQLGLPETVEVLSETEHDVLLIHCTNDYSNIAVFCESITDRIVGCIVFPDP